MDTPTPSLAQQLADETALRETVQVRNVRLHSALNTAINTLELVAENVRDGIPPAAETATSLFGIVGELKKILSSAN